MQNIIVIGDTHANFRYLNRIIAEEHPDIIFVCGDFGYWNKAIFNAGSGMFHDDIQNGETKIYFCDGNHEDHSKLQQLVKIHGWKKPIEVSKNIYYCPRGSSLVLEDGRKVLFFGGAKSTDREMRLAYFDWFPEEMISSAEFERVQEGEQYDIVVSHTCPTILVNRMLFDIGASTTFYNRDSCCDALQAVYETVKPSQWFFGHWHTNDIIKHGDCTFYAMNMTPDKGCYYKFEK